jgi:hypothetical protein
MRDMDSIRAGVGPPRPVHLRGYRREVTLTGVTCGARAGVHWVPCASRPGRVASRSRSRRARVWPASAGAGAAAHGLAGKTGCVQAMCPSEFTILARTYSSVPVKWYVGVSVSSTASTAPFCPMNCVT